MQNLMQPVNTADQLFHDGDPTQGIEGTIVTAEYMNNHQAATRDLQQEVINVLKAVDITPDPQKQDQLIEALTSFIGQKVPDATLTQKGIVQLSSATDSASETLAATPKAVKAANDNASGRVPSTRKVNNMALTSDITITTISGNAGTATKLQTARKINGVSFDGASDITITTISGNAGTATKLQTARKINGVSFDGTSDITISVGSVTSVRLGSIASYTPGNETTWTQNLGSGNVLTGIIVQDTGKNSADNIGGIYYRPVQYYMNGSWVTASSI
ncbi:TPA: phage tail protein [Escherichia coli]|nr:phage tail protein [Escherichia coli]HAX5184820.1 phage tail protein [Escherichia coli]HAX5231298.1 phage tail protein [Escherichia coli]